MRDLTTPAPRACLLTRVLEDGHGAPALSPPDPLWIVLHGRHADIAGARRLAQAHLADDLPRLLVRSARTQTRGSLAPPRGPFWFIGPLARPELSTLGDALEQLERLLGEGDRPQVSLLAQGEGAVVALCLALLCPERIAALHLIDTVVPENLHRMPLAIPSSGRIAITTDRRDMVGPLHDIFPNAVVNFAAGAQAAKTGS